MPLSGSVEPEAEQVTVWPVGVVVGVQEILGADGFLLVKVRTMPVELGLVPP